ncbi:hypothetical protein FOB66_13560 [Roseomonas mucosa]|nr:hypothetical protein FOB66_13560 [Roseomonas mucosa]
MYSAKCSTMSLRSNSPCTGMSILAPRRRPSRPAASGAIRPAAYSPRVPVRAPVPAPSSPREGDPPDGSL